MFTFLTLTSALPLNQSAINDTNGNSLTTSNNKSSNSNNHNLKTNTITNPQPAYGYGAPISVSGVVNQTYYYGSILNYSLSDFANSAWFVPDQAISVYMGYNPCYNRDPTTLACIPQSVPSTHTISDYKLSVISGKPQTGGTDKGNAQDKNGLGEDDTYGIWTNGTSTESYSLYQNYLEYNFTVQLPSQTGFQSLGISGSTTKIFEYYGGNTTIGNPSWDINTTIISISSDNDIHVTPAQSNYTITAQSNTSTIAFQVYSQTPSNPLPNSQINFNVKRLSDGVSCGTGSSSCLSALNLTVNELGGGTNKDLTDSSGTIHFTVTFPSINTAEQGTYNFSITAVLVNPTSPGATNWNTTTYFLTRNQGNWSYLTVSYQFQQPLLYKNNISNGSFVSNIYPFNGSPSDPQIRPGDYFLGIVHQAVYSNTVPVSKAPLSVTLTASNGTDYTSQLSGGFASLSYPNGSLSDSNGDLPIRIDLNYIAPLLTYNLTFTGNYTGLQLKYPTYINTTTSQNSLTYTFTVSDLYDSGQVVYDRAIPSNNVTLTTSLTNLTMVFHANATTNSIYQTYASYYPSTTVPSSYDLVNLPVNATIVNGPISGVTLSVAPGYSAYNSTFYNTSSTGIIEFVLSTKYPDIYDLTTFKLHIIADYNPMIAWNLTAYRFTRNAAVTTSTSLNSAPVSFNPHYTVVDVKYLYNNVTTNTNSFSLRPGETALFVYQTYNTTDNTVIANVPFNFSFIQGQTIPGISIFTTNPIYNVATGYYNSSTNGLIYVYFTSIYGIAPENTTHLPITINVLLNITLYNQTQKDQNFYIGEYHQGTSTYTQFQDTWSNNSLGTLNLYSQYIIAKPVWIDPITDFQVLYPIKGLNVVRPNGETIKITLKIVNASDVNLANIINYQFPVNVSLLSAYQGITLYTTFSAVTGFPGYYYTNSSGYIDFYLTINYSPNLREKVQINATVMFGNKTLCAVGCNTQNLTRWIVGQNSVTGANLSDRSFSWLSNTGLLNVTVDPSYVIGSVGIKSTTPIAAIPNSYIYLPIWVYIPKTDVNATKDGLTNNGLTNVNLGGIKVYLNETILHQNYMNVTTNGITTDSNGIAIFHVGISNNTIEKTYTIIQAYADFQNDQGLYIGPKNTTGTFNYQWLNGTNSQIGYYNTLSLLAIQNYSKGNSTNIIVARARIIEVTISAVYDQNNNPISTTTPITALRNYKLQLNFQYKKSDGAPLEAYGLNVSFQLINLGQIINHYDYTNTSSPSLVINTNSTGFASVLFQVPSTFFVGDYGIVSYDPSLVNTTQFLPYPANFTLMSKLSLTNVQYSLPSGFNDTFTGEKITVSGNLVDELGAITTTNYKLFILSELTNNLKIYGFNPSNTSITGSEALESFATTTVSTTFSYAWSVPINYAYSSLSIQIEVVQNGSIIHFVDPTTTVNINGILPKYRLPYTFDIYQNASFNFSLSNSNANYITYSNGTFNINQDYTGTILINGNLLDNSGRLLGLRFLTINNGTNSFTIQTDNLGFFSYSLFLSPRNYNFTYIISMTYYSPTTSSLLNTFNASLIRIVHDFTPPNIILISPINETYVYQTTILNITITDPIYNNLGQFVNATGVNSATVVLYDNGTFYWSNVGNANWNGVNPLQISYNMPAYISSNPTATAVILTLTVQDNAKNTATIFIILKIDRIAPTIYGTNPLTNNTYPYLTNYHFSFQALDQQTGLNNATAQMVFVTNYKTIIAGSKINMVYNSTDNAYESGSFDLYQLKNNFTIYFTISDNAGNTKKSAYFVVLADTVKPTIVLLGTTNNFDVTSQIVTFSFNVTDSGSGVNPASFVLYDKNNNVVLNYNSFSYSNSSSTYTVRGQLTKNLLQLQSSQQFFNFNASDFNGNENNLTLLFKIDIVGPQITANSVYQPTISNLIDTSKTNLNSTMQYVRFDFSDSGTPTTGVNDSYIQIEINVNSSKLVYLTISNKHMTVSDSNLKNDFTFTLSNDKITIGWNVTDLANYGIRQTYNVQYITVTWTVTQLNDNYGNKLISNNYNSLTYRVKIDALPPPPNYLSEILTLVAIFVLFIGIGIGAAYVYEKIRYVG